MKRLAFVVLTASLLYIPAVAQQTAQATCGAWRWDVKTLSDPAKRDVNFHAKPARLKRFRLRKRPNITFGKDTPRTGQVEFQN